MFLSIVIPVYNTEKYLAECLDSCLAQDIPYSDYEIICINDGSTDRSGAILTEYAEKYRNIIVINQKNTGVSAARNAGMDHARGKYVWFIDSDDRICPNVIGKLKHLAEKNSYDRIEFATYRFREYLTCTELDSICNGSIASNINLHDSSVVTSVLATEVLREHNIRFRDIAYGEDVLFMLEFMVHCHNKHSISDVIYLYRTNLQSATHTHAHDANIKRIESFYTGAVILKDFYDRKYASRQSCANALMTFIWYAMIRVAQLPYREKEIWLSEFREAGLFPLKNLPECTSKKAYVTSRTDLIGKFYEYVVTHSHTHHGFFLLCTWYKVYNFRRLFNQHFRSKV